VAMLQPEIRRRHIDKSVHLANRLGKVPAISRNCPARPRSFRYCPLINSALP
jgi:hypothetical protein